MRRGFILLKCNPCWWKNNSWKQTKLHWEKKYWVKQDISPQWRQAHQNKMKKSHHQVSEHTKLLLFTAPRNDSCFMGISVFPNSCVVFVGFSIHMKDKFIKSNNMIKKRCVQLHIFYASIKPSSTSFTIIFFKLLNNPKSLRNRAESFSKNSLNWTRRKSQTNFGCF